MNIQPPQTKGRHPLHQQQQQQRRRGQTITTTPCGFSSPSCGLVDSGLSFTCSPLGLLGPWRLTTTLRRSSRVGINRLPAGRLPPARRYLPACYSHHIPPSAEWPSLLPADEIPHIREHNIMIPPRLPAGRLQPLTTAAPYRPWPSGS